MTRYLGHIWQLCVFIQSTYVTDIECMVCMYSYITGILHLVGLKVQFVSTTCRQYLDWGCFPGPRFSCQTFRKCLMHILRFAILIHKFREHFIMISISSHNLWLASIIIIIVFSLICVFSLISPCICWNDCTFIKKRLAMWCMMQAVLDDKRCPDRKENWQ